MDSQRGLCRRQKQCGKISAPYPPFPPPATRMPVNTVTPLFGTGKHLFNDCQDEILESELRELAKEIRRDEAALERDNARKKQYIDTLRSAHLSYIQPTPNPTENHGEENPAEERFDNGYLVGDYYCQSRDSQQLFQRTAEDGDLIVKQMRKAFTYFETLTGPQIMFEEVFLQGSLPMIYGESYLANELRLKREMGIEYFNQFSLVQCPRRWGKTEGTAVFCAVYMMFVPDADITVFSPGKRQSSLFMKRFKKKLHVLYNKGHSFSVVKGADNQEVYAIDIEGNRRQITVLPSREQTVRGIGGNLVIAEEAAQMTDAFFANVVIPILGVAQTSFIGISTAKTQSSYFTKLLTMRRSDGRPAFNTFNFIMACEACIKAKTQETCDHMYHALPFYLTGPKQELLKLIYERLNMNELMSQEMQGISAADFMSAFPEINVAQTFNRGSNPLFTPLEHYSQPFDKVFVYIDPTGNGKASDLGMASMVNYRGKNVIIGLESIPDKSAETGGPPSTQYLPYVEQHLAQIREMQEFRDCVFFVAIESNMGQKNDYEWVMRKVRRCVLLSKDNFEISMLRPYGSKNSTGIAMTPFLKEAMVRETHAAMASGALAFHENLVTTYKPKRDYTKPQARDWILSKLREQFMHYAMLKKDSTTRSGGDKPWNENTQQVLYSFGGKHSGGQDDVLTCVMGSIYLYGVSIMNQKFPEILHQAKMMP